MITVIYDMSDHKLYNDDMTYYMILIYRKCLILKRYIVYMKASMPCLNIYCIIIFTVIYAMSDDILYNNDYSYL